MVDEILSFDRDDLLKQSIGNIQGTIVLMVSYFKKEGLDAKEFSNFAGNLYAQGWETAKEWSIDEVARQVALNYASMGASDIKIVGGEDEKELHFKDWPPQALLDMIKLERSDIDIIFYVNEPIMEYLGLKFSFERKEDEVIFKITK